MRISDWSSDVCSSDLRGTVERHAEANARAAVVPGDGKALKAELAHDLKAVLAHRPERVGGMVAPAGRLGAVAVTEQIRGYHRVALGQRGPPPMPATAGQRNSEARRVGKHSVRTGRTSGWP